MDPNFDSLDWTESASTVGFDDDLEMESAQSDLSKLLTANRFCKSNNL